MEEITVLVIEDNELNLKLVRSLLTLGQYQILEAADAEKGIELARDHYPDLILMDIQLPGMDGFAATRIIKEDPDLKEIPVMAMTSYAMAGDEGKAIEAGCDGYMTKPIETRSFLDTISKFIRYDKGVKPKIPRILPHRSELLIVDDESLKVRTQSAGIFPDRVSGEDSSARESELPAQHETVLHSAITDELTGLYNHAYFMRFLETEIKRSLRQKYPIILIMIGLNNFKLYNDVPGQDHVLRETGQIIKKNIREVDVAARYGSEELAIILPYTDKTGIINIVERLREAISSHSFLEEPSSFGQITASFGVASYPADAITPDDLIEKANRMLLKAKEKGKNQVCIYENSH